MKSMYKVSVIIPVYNTEKYIGECIESILKQTLQDIQIILVDDGSQDRSMEIMEEYAGRYDNIIIVRQDNSGPGVARKNGLGHATGEYVWFVDADDLLKPEACEKMYRLAKERDVDIAICNYNFFPADLAQRRMKKWFKRFQGIVDIDFLDRNTQITNKLTRREMFLKHGFRFYGFGGESGVFAHLFLHTNRIAVLDEELYLYRIGHPSLSSSFNAEHYLKNVENAMKELAFFKSLDSSGKYNEYFEYVVSYYNGVHGCVSGVLHGNPHLYKKSKLLLKSLHFYSNPYYKTLMPGYFSKLQLLGLKYITLRSYRLARWIMLPYARFVIKFKAKPEAVQAG